MSSDPLYHAVVVGAGVHGSWTALHFAKEGKKTLLLEQFTIPHSRGSSHGQSRIIRKSYPEPAEAQLMEDAFKQWKQLEKEADIQLIFHRGLLVTASPNEYYKVDAIAANLSSQDYEMLDGEGLSKRYENIANFPNTTRAVLEESAGIIRADASVQTVQNEFKKSGGTIRSRFNVTSIKQEANGTTAIYSQESDKVRAKHVVLCPGPWASTLLDMLGLHLPLKSMRIPVMYFKLKPGGSALPCSFMDYQQVSNNTREHMFGIPCFEYPNMTKIGLHGGTEATPDQRDVQGHAEQKIREIAEKYIAKHFPGIEPSAAIMETCMYTNTPDEMFIMDTHPKYKNIAFACGFSGTGFKLGPVVGKALVDIVQGRKTAHNMDRFAMDRFNKVKF